MADIIEKKRRAPGAGSKPGERRGGRRKGSLNRKTVAIRDLSEKLGVDPAEALLNMVRCDCMQVPVFDEATGRPLVGEDGKPILKWIAFSTRQRMDAAKELLPYIAPKLAATQLTGANDGPVEVASLDLTQILSDPTLAKAAQEMALMLAEQRADPAPQLPRPYDHEPK